MSCCSFERVSFGTGSRCLVRSSTRKRGTQNRGAGVRGSWDEPRRLSRSKEPRSGPRVTAKTGHHPGVMTLSHVSPLAPKTMPDMPAIDGARLATAAAGIRYKGRTDVLLVLFDEPAAVAGVLTRSKCASAPVDWCRANLKSGTARALVVNSGNANAFTGKDGREACRFTARLAARAVGCRPAEVFLASTGVIGEPLDAAAFDGVMEGMVANAKPGGWLDAAKAIMTTDTFPKVATAKTSIGKTTVTICAIAKGAGMI